MGGDQRPTSRARRIARMVGRLFAASMACGCLALSGVWLFADHSYTLDLVANLGAQVLIVCVVSAIVLAACRMRRSTIVATAACLLQAYPLVTDRAAFWPKDVAAGTREPLVVRFLHYNDSSLSDKKDIYSLMERSGADVLSILCPPVQMQFDVIYNTGLEDTYPGKLTRVWQPAPDKINTHVTAGFLVTKWPMERIDTSALGDLAEQFIAGIVQRPEGAFAVVCVHPRSPRSPARWIEGNGVVRATATLVKDLQSKGLPVVVLADLNSTPTGFRSRFLCAEAGLRHAKPLLELAGTYPDVVPLNIRTNQKTSIQAFWPASIVIDDAWVSEEIEVEGWRVEDHLRSEHRPVITELRIPGNSASGTNRTDR